MKLSLKASQVRVALLFVAATSLATIACSSGGTTSSGGPAVETDSGTTADSAAATGDAGPNTQGDGGGGPVTATGLEGFCEHYKECGGTYYSDVQACMKATLDYWKECRRPELDAFGDCMMGVSCKDFDPDAYNPANTVCSKQWSAVSAKQCN